MKNHGYKRTCKKCSCFGIRWKVGNVLWPFSAGSDPQNVRTGPQWSIVRWLGRPWWTQGIYIDHAWDAYQVVLRTRLSVGKSRLEQIKVQLLYDLLFGTLPIPQMHRGNSAVGRVICWIFRRAHGWVKLESKSPLVLICVKKCNSYFSVFGLFFHSCIPQVLVHLYVIDRIKFFYTPCCCWAEMQHRNSFYCMWLHSVAGDCPHKTPCDSMPLLWMLHSSGMHRRWKWILEGKWPVPVRSQDLFPWQVVDERILPQHKEAQEDTGAQSFCWTFVTWVWLIMTSYCDSIFIWDYLLDVWIASTCPMLQTMHDLSQRIN